MHLGIDLGTSGVKVALVDRDDRIRASATEALPVSQPRPRWSEQDPEAWWQATRRALACVLDAARVGGVDASAVEAIGLSGQMHGAVLLDGQGAVLRPAILWNDGRSDVECRELEAAVDCRGITGNLAMPGFTAPKLLWVRRHEPDVFARVARVLLPKDYLRFRLSGDFASDPSDAAGTLWLDVAARRWSAEMLGACDLTEAHMPALVEGSRATGSLRGELAREWGMRAVPIAAGGGDNAAGAVGMGVVAAGQSMLSLGTSGVFFAVSDGFHARPQQAVHSFCHALPHTWHLMSVMLNAASCLDVAARLGGYADVGGMLQAAAAAPLSDRRPWFLPYLSGERTPHNDVHATGLFHGLTPATQREDMVHAVLEGVGLGLLDGIEAVQAAGVDVGPVSVIGGGTRSSYWLQMLADIFGHPLQLHSGGDVGPALGAARLARLAVDGDDNPTVRCPQPPLERVFEPREEHHVQYRARRQPVFRELYTRLKGVRCDAVGQEARDSGA